MAGRSPEVREFMDQIANSGRHGGPKHQRGPDCPECMAEHRATQEGSINLTELDKAAYLVEGMTAGGKAAAREIEASEARGQIAFVRSELLPNPAEVRSGGLPLHPGFDPAPFVRMGIEFLEPVTGDPLFVHATMPGGWVRRPVHGDSMHSYLVDLAGEERAAIFYKAAFYDRKCSMTPIPLCAECGHSEMAHPWADYEIPPSAENDWKGKLRPLKCERSGCDCPFLQAMAL